MTPTAMDFLSRLLDPLAACLTPEVADRIVHFVPLPASEDRLEHLRSKANDGLLTTEERAEYADYIEALDFVAIFKAKAQAILDQRSD